MDSRKPATVSRGYSRERGRHEELGRIVWRESGGGDSPTTNGTCSLSSICLLFGPSFS